MNERTSSTTPSRSQNSNVKAAGDYIHKIADVPVEVREYAINKLNPVDAAGERINDAQGNPITARISAAKENGSYYGPVVLTNDKYIVQAVGKERLSAVVHRREDVELQGASLALLDSKKQLNTMSVQTHYTGNKAKVYPWAEKNRQATEPAKEAPAKEAVKPEDFMQKAAEYAKANIKHAGQREAFMKHLGNVTEQAFNKEQTAQSKTQARPAPAQEKQADNSIER